MKGRREQHESCDVRQHDDEADRDKCAPLCVGKFLSSGRVRRTATLGKVAKAENNQKDRGSNSQAFGYVVGLDSCGCLSESAEECEEGKTETQEHDSGADRYADGARYRLVLAAEHQDLNDEQ